ncbi:MAG: DUF488 family protein [Chloroflexota bacterium]|nr:DUF488 family protein [Chloroflexota bacterium]
MNGLASWHQATRSAAGFDHVPEQFDEFRVGYREELAAHAARLEELRRRARSGPLTIVYAARDRRAQQRGRACLVAARWTDVAWPA